MSILPRLTKDGVLQPEPCLCVGMGWPLVGLACEYGAMADDNSAAIVSGIGIGGVWEWDLRIERSLPCRPLWSGFLIDIVLYATIAYVLFFVPFVNIIVVYRSRVWSHYQRLIQIVAHRIEGQAKRSTFTQ